MEDETHQRVRQWTAPLFESRRVELVELTCRREGARVVLRFLVDTASGITVDQCSALSHAIGAVLDEHDCVEGSYLLEVASPGVDRPLKTGRDFERVIGRRVRIQMGEVLAMPQAAGGRGAREVAGIVASVGDSIVTIRLDGGDLVRVPLAGVVSARQEVSFRR